MMQYRLRCLILSIVVVTSIVQPKMAFGVGVGVGDTITIWGESHAPLNGEPDDIQPGFMIEIAKYIFEKNGYQIKYVLGPRLRGVKMASESLVDCVVNAKIKEHKVLEFPNEPWGYHAATLFALSDSSFEYNGINDLKKVSLGATAGMPYDNGSIDRYLQDEPRNVSFSYGKHALERQVKMLLKQRVETIISCPLLMRSQMNTMGISENDIKSVGEAKPFVGMYLACGKGTKRTRDLIALINIEIPRMRANGELKKILDKYGQTDWITIYQSLTSTH